MDQGDRSRESERQVLAAAHAALTRAYDQAVKAIEATPDPQEAFDAATGLASVLRRHADHAAELRTQAVARIWEKERISLSTLAGRIGVSKTRADQFIRAAQTLKQQEGRG